MIDPCASLGPMACASVPNVDSDVESAMYVRKRKGNSISRFLNRRLSMGSKSMQSDDEDDDDEDGEDDGTLEYFENDGDRLKKRVYMFQNKGWLSQYEAKSFAARIEGVQAGEAMKTLEHDLNMLANRMNKQKTGLSIDSSSSQTVPTSNTQHGQPNAMTPSTLNRFKKQHRIDEPPPPPFGVPTASTDVSNAVINLSNNKLIVDPKTFTKSQGRAADTPSIDDLFTELCFYAKLGFVQPSCCLQCAYRGSILKTDMSKLQFCSRWVVWRKNAKIPFDRDSVETNTLLIQCQAARRLLSGQMVEEHRWDQSQKTLLHVSEIK